jgi:hypothetical protein
MNPAFINKIRKFHELTIIHHFKSLSINLRIGLAPNTESSLTDVATNSSNRIELSPNYVLHIDNCIQLYLKTQSKQQQHNPAATNQLPTKHNQTKTLEEQNIQEP